MNTHRLISLGKAVLYSGLPVIAYVVLAHDAVEMDRVLFDVLLATLPMVLLASITWRLVWPKWKLWVKVLLHPIIYAILAAYIGHWSVFIAWIHQGLFGLGIHIWFSRKHGFTWYAVEDPERYVRLSQEMLTSAALTRSKRSPE